MSRNARYGQQKATCRIFGVPAAACCRDCAGGGYTAERGRLGHGGGRRGREDSVQCWWKGDSYDVVYCLWRSGLLLLRSGCCTPGLCIAGTWLHLGRYKKVAVLDFTFATLIFTSVTSLQPHCTSTTHLWTFCCSLYLGLKHPSQHYTVSISMPAHCSTPKRPP